MWEVMATGFAVLICSWACVAQTDPLSWIDAEKVRAAYHYANPPAPEACARLKAAGINAMILKASVEKALPWCREAKRQGMHCFLAANFDVDAEQAGLRQAVLDDGQVERYACPLEERFWREHLLPRLLERAAVADDPTMQVDGLWIDFELYSTRTGQRYYTRACYCDHCFGAFCHQQGIEPPQVAYAERKRWLEEHGYAENYQPYLASRVEGLATQVREQIHSRYPHLLLGFYPTPHNWSLLAVARGFSTEAVPILLWATDTYGGGGASRVPDDWRSHYIEQGVNARYIAGLLLRAYSARNLAAHIYQVSEKCDGYWLFTTHTLEAEEEKGDYYLAAGTKQDYWQALRLANDELDRRMQQGPDYQTTLQLGPEPTLIPALTRPELRQRIARLVAPSQAGQMMELPEVRLRGANLVVFAARAGQQVELAVRYHQVGGNPCAITWQLLDVQRNLLAEGKGAPQQDVTISAETPTAGLYFLLVNAESAAWSLARANVPVGLYAGASLHFFGPAQRLYFHVPAGIAEFTLQPAGTSARETVRVEVYDPDGNHAATAQSDEQHLQVEVRVPTAGRAGQTWSLAVTKADVGILEDNLLTLPEPLPPVVSLLPEQVFALAP